MKLSDKGKNIFSRVGTLIFCLAMMFILIFNAFQQVCFNTKSYEDSFKEWNIYEKIGISEQELNEVTTEMLKYLAGGRDALDMKATIKGENRAVFGEREVEHMKDVKQLFSAGFMWRKIMYGILALSLVIVAVGGASKALRRLPTSWFWILGVVGSVALALGIYFAVDFNGAFIKFHQILFTNDLWLLDPNTEVLMAMFDTNFFYKCAINIILRVGGAIALMSIMCAVVMYFLKKSDKEAKAGGAVTDEHKDTCT